MIFIGCLKDLEIVAIDDRMGPGGPSAIIKIKNNKTKKLFLFKELILKHPVE